MALVSVITEDGSVTCRDDETGELYHNRAGAYLEALKNFVQPSLVGELAVHQAEIVVFDQCFGLGYNSLVLVDYLMQNRRDWSLPIRVKIDATEIDAEILSLIPAVIQQPCFESLQNGLTVTNSTLSSFGEYRLEGKRNSDDLVVIDVKNTDLRSHLRQIERVPKYDLIFHDPFSPSKVPEFWTTNIFSIYREILNVPHGKTLTYSSASAVRGGLIEAGFDVWRTEAVGGKSGGTMATLRSLPAQSKPCSALPLHENESEKLATVSGVPYRDPTLSDARKEILDRRRTEQQKKAH